MKTGCQPKPLASEFFCQGLKGGLVSNCQLQFCGGNSFAGECHPMQHGGTMRVHLPGSPGVEKTQPVAKTRVKKPPNGLVAPRLR